MSGKPRITSAELDRVRDMLIQGRTVLEIAGALKRPRQTIWRIASGRYELPVPTSRRRRTGHLEASASSAATRSSARSLRPAGAKAAPFSEEWWLENDERFRAAYLAAPLNVTATHGASRLQRGGADDA